MALERQIEIKAYEPWMMDGIAELRSRYQESETAAASRELFEHRFFHAFSAQRSVIIVALDGERVVGTQTYTYWPYSYRGKAFYSVQSGLTLVDEGYRGKRIFLNMLGRGHEILEERGVDFVMGFPGKMSYEGFIKDGWSHVGTPMFMVRPLKPGKLLAYRPGSGDNKASSNSWVDRQAADNKAGLTDRLSAARHRAGTADAICLEADHDFIAYRYGVRESNYKVYSYGEGQDETVFVCKMFFFSGFNALGIGDIHVRDTSGHYLGRALGQLIRDVRDEGNIDSIAILIKNRGHKVMRTLLKRGFIPFPSQRTPFIVKPVCMKGGDADMIKDYSRWSLMLADKDTWYIRGIYS